jgi:UDP-N-acetylmuramoyl-L-alanyl-D-glutamate--2,6-diaminopimelate ligase
MGKAVAEGSDFAIVTSDNPRTEDPKAILDDIVPGLAQARGVLIEIDRRKAIAAAIQMAQADDVILIAGKGHEDYQILGTARTPFDDRTVARELMATRG